ncbi:outer membrane efflux protein [Desulfotomaculum nigrificans CO-1-SRB]|uniref:Outer membrane efflux protein n=1 Tax=Desulfotomaculum nigrificans (strain DSM 14880 / VKM B-2319 / CO-1-SRB) TaxID=868595 RepID=F6B5K6_DESCC|nr:TolC family protein [Desulfotomaculum nigrificans]AEF95438.1 outer membrane efflux protein [Desulfotomaculum nigrificans CO-1-SRB]
MKKIMYLILTVALVLTTYAVAYADETLSKLTLNDALKKAFNSSITLKNDQTDIEKTKELFDDASSSLRYNPVDISFNPSDTNFFSNYYNAEFNRRKAIKKYDNDRRQLIVDVTTAYYNVIQNQKQLEAAKVAYERSQIKLLQAKAKNDIGLITKADLAAAEAQVATDKASMVDCQSKLDSAYADLNKLMGISLGERYQLVDLPKAEKQEIDVDAKVNMAADVSYEMWNAKEAANLADKIKLFQRLYDVGDYNAAEAANTALDTKDNLRKQARALCFSINSLYEKNNQLLEQIEQFKESLKVAKAQYEAGMTTKDTVLNAEYALKSAEAGQLQAAAAYEVAVASLERLTGELPTDIESLNKKTTQK